MSLVLLLGGARSGKSALAVRLAEQSGQPVTFVATAEARDEEMAVRIARHRAARPAGWTTIEEPVDLAGALERVAADSCLVLDCLSLWLANALERGLEEEEIRSQAADAAVRMAAREPLSLAVSNEVGLGVVPATGLGRRYRDLLGAVNAIWSETASQAVFVAAGRLLPLLPPQTVFQGLDG
jgi:adenosylcobinamide kinase / adenosylcobinamide-phosphate guanylyltransferase